MWNGDRTVKYNERQTLLKKKKNKRNFRQDN